MPLPPVGETLMTVCPTHLANTLRRERRRVVLVYLLLAVAWIVSSDAAVGAMIGDTRMAAWLQTVKGVFFVFASAAMLYLLLMHPLGILYFSVAITLLALSLGFIAAPVAYFLPFDYVLNFGHWNMVTDAPWMLPLMSVFGVVLLFATLHLARFTGLFHGWLAKHLLVRL